MARLRLTDGLLLVGRPGVNNVENLPPGHDGLAFDSRIEDFGIIHKQGIVTWVNSPTVVPFPAMPYVPLATIRRIDANNRVISDDYVSVSGVGGVLVGMATPYVAAITNSYLAIYHFGNPYWGVPNPGGRFLYTVYAIEVA